MPVQLTTGGYYNVPYFEEPEGWRERWSTDGLEMVRACRVQWYNAKKFVMDVVGWPSVFPDGTLHREVPCEHPYEQDMYAVSAELRRLVGTPSQDALGRFTVEERGADGSAVDPGSGTGWVVYDVTYKRLDYSIKADDETEGSELSRYVVRDPRFGVDALPVPGQTLKWGAVGDVGQPAGIAIPATIAGSAIPQPTDRLFPMATYIYTWKEVPGLKQGKLLAALGRINDAPFDGKDYHIDPFPAETLLFNQLEVRRIKHATNAILWEIQFQFLYRATGWRKILSPGPDGNFYKTVPNTTGPGLYGTTSFDLLFDLS